MHPHIDIQRVLSTLDEMFSLELKSSNGRLNTFILPCKMLKAFSIESWETLFIISCSNSILFYSLIVRLLFEAEITYSMSRVKP